MTMIECTPHAWWSWDYTLYIDGVEIVTRLDLWVERGSIDIDGRHLEIRKHGLASGHWTLHDGETTVISVQKRNLFVRTFDFTGEYGEAILYAPSAMSREMIFEAGDQSLRIAPVRLLSRRATITGTVTDRTLIAFVFWLASGTWRRNAMN
jgi:hypothetical protein